jgi:hypothetical protein
MLHSWRGVFHVAANPPEGGRWAPIVAAKPSAAQPICALISARPDFLPINAPCVCSSIASGLLLHTASRVRCQTMQRAQKAFWEMWKRDGRTILMMRPAHPIYYRCNGLKISHSIAIERKKLFFSFECAVIAFRTTSTSL